jgi:hypothetical protein
MDGKRDFLLAFGIFVVMAVVGTGFALFYVSRYASPSHQAFSAPAPTPASGAN